MKFTWVLVILVSSAIAEKLLECTCNDVIVNCVRSCQKLCVDQLVIRKCRYVKCKRGCACAPGMVRKRDITGFCIHREDCKRWII
ncbi:SCO-spondin [Drosophila obscura]|uniref:SCO-spondin n=1 Tax=Drosophila obscura TaxID=7282 RepID=UPI000B9FE371|nr:SCO-spondin [Drosophila obscura]